MRALNGRWQFVLVAAGLIGALGLGSAPRARADEPRGSDVAEIVIREETSIEDFLRAVGPRLGAHIGWDPASKIIKDKRMVAGTLRAEPSRLISLVRNLLLPYDLVLIPMGSGKERWYFAMDAKQQGAAIKLKPEVVDLTDQNLAKYEGEDGLFVTATIRVHAMRSLRDARQALTKVTTQNLGNVTEVPDANAFVVTDFAPNVVAIYRLIRQMDVAPSDVGEHGAGRLVTLQHAPAYELGKVLSAHFAPPPPAPPTPQAAAPAPTAVAAGPRITAAPRTNQLLIAGTAAEIRDALEVIKALDVPVAATSTGGVDAGPVPTVITTRSANARELANTLNNLVSSSQLWMSPSGQRPTFLAHSANMLLVAAPERALPAIRELVRSLEPEPAASAK